MASEGILGDRFGLEVEDYALHRADFPAAGLDQMVLLGVGKPDQCLIDLGCGTGTMARQLAGRDCRVTGLDVDMRMLEAARRLAVDGPQPRHRLSWLCGSAEETGLRDQSFEVATAAQCWHWFDGKVAAAEVRRILAPSGRLCVCGFDWLPLSGTLPGLTESLIEVHNPAWDLGGIRDPGPEALADLQSAGFAEENSFTFDIDVIYDRNSWRRRIGASAGIVNLDKEAREAFDFQLATEMDEQFPGEEVVAPHRVWGLVAVAPEAPDSWNHAHEPRREP